MKIKQNANVYVLLQATCSMILIAVTYATSPPLSLESRQRQQQRQAEVNAHALQIPPRPVKFGEKLEQQNEVFLPTQLPARSMSGETGQTGRQGRHNISGVPTNRDSQRLKSSKGRQESQRSRQSSLPINESFIPLPVSQETSLDKSLTAQGFNEHISLPTHAPSESARLSRRRSGGGTGQNQVVVQQHDIPIVEKSYETTLYKPITPTVGQQRQRKQPQQLPAPSNANRSRFPTANEEQPAADQRQPLTAIATTAMRNNQQRRQQQSSSTVTARTSSHKNLQHSTLSSSTSSSSRNSNHNALSDNKSNTFNTSHQNNNSNRLSSQPFLNRNAGSADNGGNVSTKKVAPTALQHRTAPANGRSMHTRKSATSTTATTTTTRPFFSLPNEYNIFSPEFWRFLNPTTRAPDPTTTTPITTKKPPKKYIPHQQTSAKEEKQNYSKVKTIHPPTKTTSAPEQHNTSNKKDDGPFRIALPTFNILNAKRESGTTSDKDKRDADEDEDLREKFNCPRESEVRFQLFPKICKVDDDCRVWNRGEICCEIFGAKSCVSGIPKPLEETSHSPILGLIPRKCPDRPLAELWWEVKECDTDMDCWPRVCCPDGRRRYCRTSQPELNTVPVPVKRSFNYLTEYLECTAPPPPIFDLHPKACTSTLDCFPNVCCQEAGLRHCRPPKKSVLTMLANVFNVDLVKRLTQNIVIK